MVSGFTSVAHTYSTDVCYCNFRCVCVYMCVCVPVCVCVCVHISRSQANICPPQHSWDVMSPAFNRDDLLSTHSLPTDGQPLSAGRPALRHTDTQIRARLQANVPERNVRKRRAQTDLTHTDWHEWTQFYSNFTATFDLQLCLWIRLGYDQKTSKTTTLLTNRHQASSTISQRMT